MPSYTITRAERHGDAYFTLRWSPFARADKYAINRSVPAMGGVAELWYRESDRHPLELFCILRSWYGGLRATLREHSDPVLEKDPYRLAILSRHEGRIFHRWSLTESSPDMDDVVFFLTETWAPGSPTSHSGRYNRIYLKEIDPEDELHR